VRLLAPGVRLRRRNKAVGAQEVLAAVRHPVRTESSSGVARAWLMTGAVLRERGRGQARHGEGGGIEGGGGVEGCDGKSGSLMAQN
jgi:hypothetical protein